MSRARGPQLRGGGGRRRGQVRWPAGVRKLPASELRWVCDPALLERTVQAEAKVAREEARALKRQVPDPKERARIFEQARLSDRPPVCLEELVGQERPIEAISMGLGTEAPGFHVFVCGPPGSGRLALVQAALERFRPPLPRPRDRVYVANFRHPERPLLLTLPRGKGRRFRRDLDDMVGALRRSVPAALSHEQHVAKSDRLRRRAENAAARKIEDLAAELRPEGLIVGPIPEGFGTPELLIDARGGEPLPRRVVQRKLARRELRNTRALRELLARYDATLGRLEEVAQEARAIARRGTFAQRRLDADVARAIAQGFTDDLAKAYPTRPVRRWLDTLLEEIGEQVELFLESQRDEDREGEERRYEHQEAFERFRANLFVDTKERPIPPLIFEPNPTYQNLFGAMDSSEGNVPDHMRLRAGSLLQANGGIIVVDAHELMHDRAAWGALKRTVRSGWVEVQRSGGGPGGGLRPERIRTAFKLVAIGTEDLYDTMDAYDPEFASVFKVKVQLEEAVPRTHTTVQELGRALLRIAHRSGLKSPDAAALARLLEHSARLAGRNDRLLPWFAELLDVLQEADRLARPPRGQRTRGTIRAQDVEAALLSRRRRHDLGERQAQELLDDQIVLIECSGKRAGVINALVVYDEGAQVFSRPTRVSAAVGIGRKGLVDVEREAAFSGDSHRKGVEILGGFLRERYAQDKPLCLTATICFEQSYSVVDGDSASLAEALVLLSALGELPLNQGWAVTGSLNQKGEVQAVGDVSAKVEGFFDTCQARGLTGEQGVIVPEANVRDLMLREDVVRAVERGRFHVVAVRLLDEALELLTGLPAGTRPSFLAPYVEGTANARVDARLLAYAEAARRFDRGTVD